MSGFLLEMKGICKEFPGVKALDDVSFQLRAGEVHALLGENGAGKSTLIKVLGAIYKADAGEIWIDGDKVEIKSVDDAKAHGISIIHQELMVVPEMSIAENIFLGRTQGRGIWVDMDTMNNQAQKMLNSFDLKIDAKTKVGRMSIAHQQMVEIIRAISFGARIIVMDEPTSSLSENEVGNIFNAIRKLRDSGIGIIYISHRMSELDEITDRITVMRDGRRIGTVDTKTTSKDKLISMMVGRTIDSYYIKDSVPEPEEVLRVEDLEDGDMVKGVSFSVRRGEILGFAGLVGAGRSETMKCLFGITKKTRGRIFINGRQVLFRNTKVAMKAGIGLVPENRKEEGIFPARSVRFNTSIEVLDSFMRGVVVDKAKEEQIADTYCKRMKVRTPGYSQLIGKLSGGNQQKVIIGRWLAREPKVLILDEPTKGIDVGAKAEIYSIMNDLAKTGVSIILVSSELPEIINMSDRVLVMNGGRIAGEITHDFTQEEIMCCAAIDMDGKEVAK